MAVPFKIDLSGKVAVVTGGGGILCSGMALALAECGAKVAILDLRKEAADKVADEIKAVGGKAIGVACNVLDRASLEEANKIVKDTFGPCNILINGAGGNNPKGTTDNEVMSKNDLNLKDAKTFYTLDPKGIEFVFNLNFLGSLLPTQVFTQDMVAAENGVVVNISSMNAFKPLTKIPAYSAAKAAVSNFTQWLAVHMAPVGIRVNAIAPGFFLTDQNRALLTTPDGGLTPRSHKILNHTPMNKFGQPSDLIGALLWLVSDEAAGFVTGTVIPIDGGFSAYSGV
ncbi:MAG: SDR family oxidoreductase [Lentisphaerae bacterium]|jgi:NAD(P)-dependent dehydrogenase (short-subunit alcohol dehydrogenase family)|nr:SDR family oxidoreductase [Lentisphaerota bacterium]